MASTPRSPSTHGLLMPAPWLPPSLLMATLTFTPTQIAAITGAALCPSPWSDAIVDALDTDAEVRSRGTEARAREAEM